MDSYFSAVASILGIFGLIGGAMGTLLASRQGSTVRVLKDDNGALRDRVTTLEGTEHRCQERLAALEDSNRVLQGVVTGAAVLDEIRHQQETTLAHLSEMDAMLRQLIGRTT